MNPALPDLLTGIAVAVSIPPPPECGPDYAASRLGLVAMLASLAAHEARDGPAVRIWENAAIAERLADALGAYDQRLDGALSKALDEAAVAPDLTWSGMDRLNAVLRRALIVLHECVEAAGDAPRDQGILRLYADMSERRRLKLPGE